MRHWTRPWSRKTSGLPVRETIRLGRVKTAPYTVKGSRYVLMTVASIQTYQETRRQPGSSMTANGELFNPRTLTAAHTYLPFPTDVQVTNLENGRSIILRVNDRAPFRANTILTPASESST